MKAIPILTPKETDRFWSKVDRREIHECWNWLAGRCGSGYGSLKVFRNGKQTTVNTHRMAWHLATGLVCFEVVRHDCDNPACCNPFHLCEGSPSENTADMVARGRQTYGGKNPKAKLHDELVIEIFNDPRPNTLIALQHGVTDDTVSLIKLGKTWRHLQLRQRAIRE